MTFLTIKNLTFYYYEAGLENSCEKPSFIFIHPKTFKSPRYFTIKLYLVTIIILFLNLKTCMYSAIVRPTRGYGSTQLNSTLRLLYR